MSPSPQNCIHMCLLHPTLFYPQTFSITKPPFLIFVKLLPDSILEGINFRGLEISYQNCPCSAATYNCFTQLLYTCGFLRVLSMLPLLSLLCMTTIPTPHRYCTHVDSHCCCCCISMPYLPHIAVVYLCASLAKF